MHPTSTAAGAFPRLSMATFALILSLGPAWSQADPAAATSTAASSVVKKASARFSAADIEAELFGE